MIINSCNESMNVSVALSKYLRHEHHAIDKTLVK